MCPIVSTEGGGGHFLAVHQPTTGAVFHCSKTILKGTSSELVRNLQGLLRHSLLYCADLMFLQLDSATQRHSHAPHLGQVQCKELQN